MGGNILPQQHSESIPNPHRRGSKLQKQGLGGFRPYSRRPHDSVRPSNNASPASARVPKGDYFTPPSLIEDRRPDVVQKPLSKVAEKLLADYFKRVAFSIASAEGCPDEWAGRWILGVRKARTHQIRTELCNGPIAWFQSRAMQCIWAGTIGHGRATAASPVGDRFFIVLSGGDRSFDRIRTDFSGHKRIDLEEAQKLYGEIQREVSDYAVHSNLLFKMR
jgi:hypothetical protein